METLSQRKLDQGNQSPCPHCSRLFDSAHVGKCAQRPVTCQGCGEKMTAGEFAQVHMVSVCPERIVSCPLCDGKLRAKLLADHKTKCACRKVKCPDCGNVCMAKEFEKHKEEKHKVVPPPPPVVEKPRDKVCEVCLTILSSDDFEDHSFKCKPRKQRGACGLEVNEKMVVVSIRPQGPADRSGIKLGDTLKSVKGVPTRAREELAPVMATCYVDEIVPFEVQHEGMTTCNVVHVRLDPPPLVSSVSRKKSLKRMKAVANQMTNAQSVEQLKQLIENKDRWQNVCRQCFDIVDRDKNGVLDKLEIRDMVSKVATVCKVDPPIAEEVDECFDEIDADHDQKVTFGEFEPYLFRLFDEIINPHLYPARDDGSPLNSTFGSTNLSSTLNGSGGKPGSASQQRQSSGGRFSM